jgi:hypothetical protein
MAGWSRINTPRFNLFRMYSVLSRREGCHVGRLIIARSFVGT